MISDLMKAPRKTTHDLANVSRRGFVLGVGAGSLVLAVGLPRVGLAEEAKKYAGDGMPHGLRDDPKIFVAIAPDGTVTVICHRSEMGQGVRTSLPMIVADELEADWARVKVAQAPGDEERFGNQDTDGSRSTRHHFHALRHVGAAARTMLVLAAAKQWGVPADQVEASNHELVDTKTGKKIGFGAVAAAASELPVPAKETIVYKPASRFRYIGKGEIGLVDNMDITTGKTHYGIDTRLDGMLYAVVARAPVYGGTVVSYDAAETLKVKGVKKVVAIDPTPMPSEFMPLAGIAVIADNTWAAIQGREKLKVVWEDGANKSYSSDSYKAALEAAARKPGQVVRNEGDVDAAMGKAVRKIEAEYYVPHLAHASMEPPAATARIVNGKCEAWACVQSPQAARDRLAKRLGMKAEDVTVNVTLLGGGFGRKSKPDYVVEAGLLSKAMDGAPVKVTWTREDDLQHDYLHSVSVQHLEAGLDDAGKPVAWLHRSVFPSIGSTFAPNVTHGAPFEFGLGLISTPFAVPNLRLENPEAVAHTRIGWFRSVNNIQHAFAIQSFAAELAAAAGRDQKDYLLELIGPVRKLDPAKLNDWNHGEDPAVYQLDTGRLAAVIQEAAKGIGWGRALPKGSGLGIAGHYSFMTYVAAAIEVKVDKGKLSIPRVDIAIDCGPQVNPERIRAQLEGATVMGISVATLGEITFKDGRVEQANYDGFEVTRIDAAPREIHVHLMPVADYDRPLGGVGEPGVPPIAPALCNAIFAATGKRIRRLPIRDQLSA